MKRMTKWLCCLLMLCLLISVLPITAHAASGKCGENVTWTLSGGTLTISGTGPMYDYEDSSDVPWYIIRDSIRSVVIESGVTTIGDRAFFWCDSLPSVTIGNSVTTIGDSAFHGCESLTSVTIGNSVATIGEGAFYYCESLTSVTIGNSVATIGEGAFSYCKSLTSVTIPNSVTTIGDSAFYSCDSLTSVTIGNSASTIGEDAFGFCLSLTGIYVEEENPNYSSDGYGVLFNKQKTKLIQAPGGISGSYSIPNSVITIGDRAFQNCRSLTSVTIGNSVATIGEDAFDWCIDLTSVTIPNSVTTIGDGAFYTCNSLTSVTIPNSVTTIGDGAFGSCDSLTSVTIGNSVTSIAAAAFAYCDSLTSVTIPNSVTTIGDGAFRSCDSLTSVTIGNSTTTIGNSAFYECGSLINVTIPNSVTTIGEVAFAYCDSLTGIYVEEGNPNYSSDGYGVLFNKQKTKLIQVPGGVSGSYSIPNSVTTIGDSAFFSCDSLTSVTIPNSVTTIGDSAFRFCDSLTTVTIPNSVTKIGAHAFHYCYSLNTVTIGNSVTTIGEDAFWSCDRLEKITFQGSAPSIGTDAFYSVTATAYYPENNTTWTSDVMQDYGGDITWVSYTPEIRPCGQNLTWTLAGDTLTISGSGAMYNWDSEQDVPWYSHRGDITQIVIQSGVTSVGDRAFQGLAGVSALRIPDTVTYIGNSAFRDCTGLTGIALGNQVARIYSEAFANCTRLVEVTFPASVREIGSVAFSGCTRLQQVKFLGNAPGFGTNVFKNVKATAFYPSGNGSWSASVRQNYGGTITWASYDAADTPPVSAFTDVKSSDYFYEPVLWAVEQNITGGIGNGRFGPNQACTRGQIVTFLWAANGRPEPQSSENPFRDVKTSDYFYKAVLWAVEKGITSGVRPGQFGPSETCTRGQVATFLWAARGRPVPTSVSNSFSDVKSSDYYYSAVLWAVENGITGGVGKGRFGPGEICTRGQIVTFLYKAYA